MLLYSFLNRSPKKLLLGKEDDDYWDKVLYTREVREALIRYVRGYGGSDATIRTVLDDMVAEAPNSEKSQVLDVIYDVLDKKAGGYEAIDTELQFIRTGFRKAAMETR
jgi:hypothetical protein